MIGIRLLPMAAAVVCVGCSTASKAGPSTAFPAPEGGRSGDGMGDGSSPDTDASIEDFSPTENTFDCLKNPEWAQVGASVFKNVLGHTDEMLAVAQSPEGGTFPVGTVIQLLPTEANVKRGVGFSSESHDWEFFVLAVSDAGTTITARGGDAGVVNPMNRGVCLNCHGQAAPQWDLLCSNPDGGASHGCTPLPVSGATLASFRRSDPRCP